MSNNKVRFYTDLFGAWCGVFYVVGLLVGWWAIAGFFPLHKPSAGPEEIAAFFRANEMGIKIGMIMVMWASALFMFFVSTVSSFISRFEGNGGALSRTFLLAGYGNAMLTFYPPMWWLVNAFRPHERPAELTYLINDAAWIQFIGGISLVMPMFIILGVMAITDKRKEAEFPRWFGYFSFWVFVLMVPDQLLFFFKSGPFAWNGLFAFWVPLSAFGSWFLVVAYFLRRATLKRYLGVQAVDLASEQLTNETGRLAT